VDNNVADRFKKLREGLGLTQQQIADRSNGVIDRAELSKVENGENQLTGTKLRGAIATVIGLTSEELGDYVAGRMPLPDALQLAKTGSRKPVVPPPTEGFPIPADVKDEAVVLLQEDGISDRAIEIGFKYYRCLNEETAHHAPSLADEVRTVIRGRSATLPGSSPPQPRAHRSRRAN
jgi:transcriptional regulator with XRE-family HTH domain